MVPYFFSTAINLGPITIQTWGLFVALGFLVGAWASAWMCKQRGLRSAVVWDILGWLIIGSMIFARIFFVIFYSPNYFLVHPIEVFYFWQGGMSMIGGLLGAILTSLIYFRWKKINWWQYTDALVFGLPLGYAIGRIGCFLIHDHPGLPTSFFLGVQYPDGIVRHDLGLYHSLFGGFLFVVFLILSVKKNRPGIFLITFLMAYGVMRLGFDFLRVEETQFWWLTPGQWFGLFMIFSGLYFWVKKYEKNHHLNY